MCIGLDYFSMSSISSFISGFWMVIDFMVMYFIKCSFLFRSYYLILILVLIGFRLFFYSTLISSLYFYLCKIEKLTKMLIQP